MPHLESPLIAGHSNRKWRTYLNRAAWMVPPLGAWYTKLASLGRALANKRDDMAGFYHLYLIGSR